MTGGVWRPSHPPTITTGRQGGVRRSIGQVVGIGSPEDRVVTAIPADEPLKTRLEAVVPGRIGTEARLAPGVSYGPHIGQEASESRLRGDEIGPGQGFCLRRCRHSSV